MDWPTGAFLSRHIRLPADVQLRQLGRADVPAVLAALAAWDPDLAKGKEHVLLTGTFYDDTVALVDEGHTVEERPVYVLLLQAAMRNIAAMADKALIMLIFRSTP